MILKDYPRLYKYHLYPGIYREGLIIENNGCWGEIAPLPGFSKETLADSLQEVKKLWPDLTNAKLPSVRFGWASAQKPLRSVRVPMAALKVPRPGFSTLKLKLGNLSVKEAIERVKNHRQYHLRLDFNKRWSLDQALEFSKNFKPSDFDYLEEPVNRFEDLILFSKMTQFPIAIDESVHQNWTAIPTLKAIVVKPTVVGYIPHAPKQFDLILSSSYETGLGLIHIALLANPKIPAGLDTVSFPDLLRCPIKLEQGFFSWNYTKEPIDRTQLCRVL